MAILLSFPSALLPRLDWPAAAPTVLSPAASRAKASASKNPSNKLRDAELVLRALRGDRNSADEVVRRLAVVRTMVRAQWVRYGGRPDDNDLDDVTQDAQLAIWKRLGSFDGRVALEAWVWGFCRNHVLKAIERGSRAASSLAPEAFDAIACDEPPQIGETLDHALLNEVLESLGEPAGSIVRLKHFEDLTFQDIGARLDLSPNTAKTHYYRCLAKLRLRLLPFAGEANEQ